MAQTTALKPKPSSNGITPPPRMTSIEPYNKLPKKDPDMRKNLVLAWTVKTDIITRIKKIPTDDVHTLKVDCTKDMAMDLLTLNDMGKNRYIDEKRIERYKKKLLKGKFPVNGETIKVSKTFKLIDGQHRLWAIVESGITLRILIVTGIEDKAMAFIDIGKNRTAVDMVVINEYRNHATSLAYCIKNLIYYKNTSKVSSSLSNADISNDEVDAFLEKKKQVNELNDFIELGIKANKKVPKWLSAAQWACIYHILMNLPFSNPDREKKRVTEFMLSFIEGTDLTKHNPIKKLRDLFMSDFKEFTRYKNRNKISGGLLTVKFKFVIEAWNRWYSKDFGPADLEVDLQEPRIQKPLFR